jgi:hypothetical protein
MTDTVEAMRSLEQELRGRIVPTSIEGLSERLEPLSIGLSQRIPVAVLDTRMFRVRRMDHKPALIDEVGAPPPKGSPVGRLNGEGQSVLYLADSPDTAFAESRATAGEFCLSEWRVNVQKLAMANGGIPQTMLAERFPNDIDEGKHLVTLPNANDERVLNLFREIYTLEVGEDRSLYRWSIACGLVNGFSHQCDRDAAKTADGLTHWNGRYPFTAIAYPSMRTDRTSLNYAFNDVGRSHLRLDHVQWVRRAEDGSYASLDYANSWDNENRISWQNRPATFQLKPGERSKVVKIAETTWRYETGDGSTPWFG